MPLQLGEYKVLVRSYYREATVKTYEEAVRNKDGSIEHIPFFRHFHEHECWMTPEEADFLVNSDENKAHSDQGFITPYSFPMGSALPVPADFGGKKLEPPQTEAALATTDVRQADAARRKMEAAERKLAAQKAADGEPAAAGAAAE